MKSLRSIAARNASGDSVEVRELGSERVRAAALRILGADILCSMATVSPDARAHINTAYFAYSENFEICFLSHPNARHCQNLRTNPSMAVSVFSAAQSWPGPDRGLQLFGTCRPAMDAQAVRAADTYATRFTPYQSWAAGLREGDAGREYRFFWFAADEIKLLDEREFGDGIFVSALLAD